VKAYTFYNKHTPTAGLLTACIKPNIHTADNHNFAVLH